MMNLELIKWAEEVEDRSKIRNEILEALNKSPVFNDREALDFWIKIDAITFSLINVKLDLALSEDKTFELFIFYQKMTEHEPKGMAKAKQMINEYYSNLFKKALENINLKLNNKEYFRYIIGINYKTGERKFRPQPEYLISENSYKFAEEKYLDPQLIKKALLENFNENQIFLNIIHLIEKLFPAIKACLASLTIEKDLSFQIQVAVNPRDAEESETICDVVRNYLSEHVQNVLSDFFGRLLEPIFIQNYFTYYGYK